jgi:hypothetical protein
MQGDRRHQVAASTLDHPRASGFALEALLACVKEERGGSAEQGRVSKIQRYKVGGVGSEPSSRLANKPRRGLRVGGGHGLPRLIHYRPMSSSTPITSVEEEQEIECPICATVAVTIEDGCVLPPCEHVRFIYINGEAFEYAEPGLEAWLQAEEDRANEDEDLDEYDVWAALQKYVEPNGMILERVDHDMACGPTKLTIWVGLDKTGRRSQSAC